jgi:Leucine-rich repeat (LRR) protein
MEVHESIGNLGSLFLLNLKGCKNLIKLPRSIGLLKSLDKLILSGCSKLDELPEELQTLQCLRVLRADETSINRLQSWQLNWWSWLFPRRSLQSTSFSFTFLPCSLVKLSLADCNITDDVIPDDLSSLPALEYLNLSKNPIQTLPESMNSLSMLQDLLLNHCRSLRSLPELPTSLKKLRAEKCTKLERIANLPNLLRSLRLNLIGCKRLVQVQGLFNLEMMREFDAKMIYNLHLFNIESLGSIEVEMINSITKTSRITRLQVITLSGFKIMSFL